MIYNLCSKRENVNSHCVINTGCVIKAKLSFAPYMLNMNILRNILQKILNINYQFIYIVNFNMIGRIRPQFCVYWAVWCECWTFSLVETRDTVWIRYILILVYLFVKLCVFRSIKIGNIGDLVRAGMNSSKGADLEVTGENRSRGASGWNSTLQCLLLQRLIDF